jgi:hypothetical protein
MVSLHQDGKKPSIWKPAPATIPGTVEAHDAGSVSLYVDELAEMDLDPSRPITPRATPEPVNVSEMPSRVVY